MQTKTRPRGIEALRMCIAFYFFFHKRRVPSHLLMQNTPSNIVCNELTRNNTKEMKISGKQICLQMYKHLPLPTFTNMNRTPAKCKMPHSPGLCSRLGEVGINSWCSPEIYWRRSYQRWSQGIWTCYQSLYHFIKL